MPISIIVAASQNNVIGKDNQLIWRLSADLKRFKALTTGHHIIMGRKTFDSIGKPLPNRTSIIITRQADYKVEGCIVVNSLEEALAIVPADQEAFIIGGGTIYKEAIDKADKLYLTLVHSKFDGDTFFPKLEAKIWNSVKREDYMPDAKNEYAYSFIDYERK
ncbi:dihydrofolate reductase [Ancylomarina euxinus]|uniref:Dihydrofolate reductase n=1 Tax=Ancylomarina euxinus TaxID=2283627 RepID=A0A425Y8R1_9BACT|nr:dihydrofolate reductase [Ancylomarina euxinus]MCZ4693316.1 dihydrofolate reductase [Ancylomarina euxinus]MUP13544.1 dihydrofolate reductase [Ancylomarina euxinus]RRG24807.1 dihydrofolate reductase [Ancylomarina euxinus]